MEPWSSSWDFWPYHTLGESSRSAHPLRNAGLWGGHFTATGFLRGHAQGNDFLPSRNTDWWSGEHYIRGADRDRRRGYFPAAGAYRDRPNRWEEEDIANHPQNTATVEPELNTSDDSYLADDEDRPLSAETTHSTEETPKIFTENTAAQPELMDDILRHNFAEYLNNLKESLQALEQEREKIRDERIELARLRETFEQVVHALSQEGAERWKIREDQDHRSHGNHPSACKPQMNNTEPRMSRDAQQPHRSSNFSDINNALKRYDHRWLEIHLAVMGEHDAGQIPWPTQTLKIDNLSDIPSGLRTCFRHQNIHAPNISQIRQWNAFHFFLTAFGLKACDPQHYCGKNGIPTDDRCELRFNIDLRGKDSMVNVRRLKSKLLEEKRRWHPDGHLRRFRLQKGSNEDECAKAVFNGVVSASQACRRLMTGGLEDVF